MNHTRWLRHYWAIASILAIGIIAATGLAATGPVLVDKVLTFAFRRVLLNTAVTDGNLHLSLRENMTEAGFTELDNLIQTTIGSHFADFPHMIFGTGTLPTLMPWQDGELLTAQRLNIRFYGDDWQERVTVVAGDWPEAELMDVGGNPLSVNSDRITDNRLPLTIAVIIGEPTAAAYNLDIGDRLPLSKQANNLEPDLWLEVAAIVQPINGQDPFWYGELSPLRARDDGRFLHYNALISRNTFFALATTLFPDQSSGYAWPVLIEPNNLTLNALPLLQERLATLPDQLFQANPQIQLATGLPTVVNNFAQQVNDVRTPLTFLTATTALLAFFFVAMAAAMATVRLQNEWDLLRSRGMSTGRLLGQQAVRTIVLILPAILLGAALAWLLLRGLTVAGPLADIREPDWTVDWPTAAWTAAFVAAVACALVLLWPFVGLSRQPIASRLQETYRPDKAGWWQRYYVDVIIVATGLILLGRFVANGGFMNDQINVRGADWLLVIAPIATMLGGLAILLRLFPPLLHAVSRLLGHWPQSVPFLALAYSARSHRQATRLVLLFALTVALGIFAASVDDALAYNELARAHYAAGGEARLIGIDTAVAPITQQTATIIWRGQGSFATAMNGRYPTFDILAIEPESFRRVADLRPDFASESPEKLLGEMEAPQAINPATVPIPSNAVKIGLWLSMPTMDESDWQGMNLDFKVSDDEGNSTLLALEPSGLVNDTWRYYEAELPTPAPTRLGSLWLRISTYQPEFRENLGYDDISVTLTDGQTITIEGFEDQSRAWYSVNSGTIYLYYVPSNFEPHSGQMRLEFGFGRTAPSPATWYGLAPFDPELFTLLSLPALVSSEFSTLTGLGANDQVVIRVRLSVVDSLDVRLHIVGVVDYFPTLYDEEEAGYVVTLRDALITAVNNIRHDNIQPTELLLAEVPSSELLSQAAQAVEAKTVQQTLRAYPLAVGLRTASLLGYTLATIISLASFAAHLVFIVSQRRNQFAVLRAIGLDAAQLYALLFIEQLVLVFSGLLLGTGLGILLTWLTLHNLNFDWGGLAAAPPFVVLWDWAALARTYIFFAVTVLVALATAVLLIRRMGLQQALSVAVE